MNRHISYPLFANEIGLLSSLSLREIGVLSVDGKVIVKYLFDINKPRAVDAWSVLAVLAPFVFADQSGTNWRILFTANN